MANGIDVTPYIGMKFGKLTILSKARINNSRTMVNVSCECGVLKEMVFTRIKNKNILSCGCLMGKTVFTHSLSKHPLYISRLNMIARCYNKGAIGYKRYGGRGITVCDEWLNSFPAYYEWATSNKWEHGLQIDRRDNSGNYCPENCRIVTSAVNQNNKDSNRIFIYEGVKYTLSEISQKYNKNPKDVWQRLYKGWDLKTALTTPIRVTKRARPQPNSD